MADSTGGFYYGMYSLNPQEGEKNPAAVAKFLINALKSRLSEVAIRNLKEV